LTLRKTCLQNCLFALCFDLSKSEAGRSVATGTEVHDPESEFGGGERESVPADPLLYLHNRTLETVGGFFSVSASDLFFQQIGIV
jgi:hypothetical protein